MAGKQPASCRHRQYSSLPLKELNRDGETCQQGSQVPNLDGSASLSSTKHRVLELGSRQGLCVAGPGRMQLANTGLSPACVSCPIGPRSPTCRISPGYCRKRASATAWAAPGRSGCNAYLASLTPSYTYTHSFENTKHLQHISARPGLPVYLDAAAAAAAAMQATVSSNPRHLYRETSRSAV